MNARMPEITIAANNGSIGGGEVMLLNIATALRELDVPVSIVAPQGSGEMSQLAEEGRRRGFSVTALPAESRPAWMRQLRAWDRRDRAGLLWCNGLVPAAATAGHPGRIMHLHQRPKGAAQQALMRLARLRTVRVLVPSENMRAALPGTTVLQNWCEDVVLEAGASLDPGATREVGVPRVIGFLGRPSTDKGVEVLVEALLELEARHPGRYRLALAGTAKFVGADAVDSVERALRRADHLVDRLGWVGREDLFGRADVLAVPSIWPEPFGLVAAEAMAARVPVIVSDAGALPEVVGADGSIVPAGRAAALADAIERATSDSAAAARQVEALRARWEAQFSPAAGRARVAALLASLC